MSEEQSIQGDRWTEHAVELLHGLGWKLNGDTNIDIPCVIHTGRKYPHGIDIFMTYFDPYQSKEIGIIVETKNYAWKNIHATFLQDAVDNLLGKIECAPHSEAFKDKLNFSQVPVQIGLLLLWSHDEFNKSQFEGYLNKLEIPKKHNNRIRIHILSRLDILRLYSIKETIDKIKRDLNKDETFDIYYPSYHSSDSYKCDNFVNIEYFASTFIFGKMIKFEEFNGNRHTKTITVVFYFDEFSLECLNFLYLSLRRFQLTDGEILIYHYNNPSQNRGPIEEFKRSIKEDHNKIIVFEPMNKLLDVPWRV